MPSGPLTTSVPSLGGVCSTTWSVALSMSKSWVEGTFGYADEAGPLLVYAAPVTDGLVSGP